MQISADENYGCLFCRSGQELSVIKDLRLLHPEFQYIVPQKKRYRRIGKELHEESATLFSGYVFFKATAKSSVVFLQSHRYVYRVLCNAEQDWRLQGTDHHLVDGLFAENGVVGFSEAICRQVLPPEMHRKLRMRIPLIRYTGCELSSGIMARWLKYSMLCRLSELPQDSKLMEVSEKWRGYKWQEMVASNSNVLIWCEELRARRL